MDLNRFDLPRYLSVLPLFAEMDAAELQRLAQGCQLKRLARGDMVFRVGEPCESFHVTVIGQVKLFALSPAGQEKVIELIGPGNTFAEAIMFMDKPYFVNAQALTDTLLLTVCKRTVLEEIAREPRFALRMLAGISRRLHGLVHDVEAYALHSGLQRVIGYLLRDAADHDGTNGKPLTVSLPVSARARGGRADRGRQARHPDPRRAAADALPAGELSGAAARCCRRRLAPAMRSCHRRDPLSARSPPTASACCAGCTCRPAFASAGA